MNDITLFFRKMIIIFMLFIVSFSVLLAILKPKSTNTTASKEENTHLEKMLYNKTIPFCRAKMPEKRDNF